MSHDEDIELRRAKLSLAKRAMLEKRLRGELADSAKKSGIPRQPRPDDIPLSFAQQRLWFLDQLEPDSSAYNTFNALRLEGPLNVVALEQSLNAIVERHEVLRTTFATTDDGQPMQVIATQQMLPLPLIDLQELPEHEQDAVVLRLAHEEVRQPFDLARGPLIRTRLLRQNPDTHVLLLSMHHIVFDDWSHGVFMQELVALYTSFAAEKNGAPGSGTALPIQYADYAIWQRQRLSDGVLESQLAYWKQQLADLSTFQLPTDYPRPAVFSFQGALHPFVLPQALSEELVALSRREGITLFMTLLAAFQVLLSRYSSQDDIAVGTPTAGRTRRELEGLIGFFVNTLVLRTDLSGNPSFREVLQRVRETALEGDRHQDVPFEQVVEELQPTRELDRHPLFQVMFALQNRPMPAMELPGLKLRPLQITRTTTKFDLTLSLEQSAEGLAGWVEYSTELFEAATIARMVGHFQTLLSGIIAQPDLRVAALPLLTDVEREQLLSLDNKRPAVYPQTACLHTLFAAQAARTPEAVAVTYEGMALTYQELDRRANQVAQYLRSLGVGPEIHVGLCIEPSLEVVVGLLGILKAGGAYVPIDPAYPAPRQTFILADAQAPVLLTQQRIAAQLPESVAHVVCLDAEWPTIAQLPATPPVSALTPDNLAYVIYTSGSTGTPKGVQVSHANAGRLFAATHDWFHFDDRDAWTLFHSTAFDFSVWEIWGALLYGGRLVVVPYWISRSPDAFADLLRQERVTVLNQTPSAFRQLVQAAGSAGDLPLRLVIFGGEALNLASLQSWFAYYSDQMPQLVNMYGITETTVHVTYRPLTAEDARVAAGSMIGVPIPDLQLYILDQQMQPVPVGVSGELYVGGGGVARGYLNRPALTAEKFVPDPFSATPGARLYKSGDGARYRANGDIEYLGRLDTQIKIRGFRIEVGEIEAVLSRHPGVRDAVVVVREDEPPAGGPPEKRLVAYVVENPEPRTQNQGDELDGSKSAQGHPVLGSTLRDFLRTRLPEYMVPSAFVVVAAIPLTAHGKVDRRALPAPDSARPMPEDTFVAPRTASEEVVAQIWAEVLHLDRVGVFDNFFVLGGHSLLATQVISKLRAAFQIELPLRALFEVPTVAGLSERIEAARYDTPAPLPPLRPIPRDGVLPLSFAQQRLWFLDQLEHDNPIYNLPFAAYLNGKLDIAALEQSLDTIVARHEVLRTAFQTTDDRQPMQVIAAAEPLPLPLVDLQELPEDERDAAVLRLATKAALQPLDVTRGPLLRACLLRVHPDAHVLLLTMHHIIADGWSLGVFIRELSALYAATVSGVAAVLPPLSIQYADYAVWQRAWLQGEVLEAQLSYWRQQLADLTVLELPSDYPRPPALSFRGALHSFTLSKTLSKELVALSQREGVTLFMTLLAAFQVLLSRYSSQDDIAVGTPIAGRTRAETEDLIGFFVNTLVLRTNLASSTTFQELLQRVRAVCLGAYAHQDLPFEQVVEELQPARDLSRHPLFQVMFALQNAPVTLLDLPDLKVDPFVVDHGLVKFDLSLEFEETESGLAGMLAYNTDLFTLATIERLLGHLAMLLTGIVADPQRRLVDLPLLTAAEEQQFAAWSPRPRAVPCDPSVPALLAAQAARTPDAVAVVCGDAQLTYRDLDQRANQLAHALRERGVGPEVRVGLYCERSLDLVVALLGIWKAGGAYVPIDPAYPATRRAFLLADAQIALVLTQTPLLSTLPADLPTLCLGRDAAGIAQKPTSAPLPPPAPEQLAYVIYTSGSTGTPKGVAVTHANLRATLWASQQQFAFQADDVLPWIAAVAFDIALFELCSALLVGGTVRVLTPAEALDAPALLTHLAHCTAIHAVPSLMQHLVQAIRATGELGRYGHVRQVFVGGDRVPPELLAALQAVFAQAQVWVLYGPTEATIICAAYALPRGGAERGHPIGRPLPHAALRLCDAQGRRVPIGVAGELYVGGPAVTRGYLGRPELTAEKFVPLDGARWYRTGDRARYRADGVLEFLGRADGQVKVRGYRIELGEVEAALGQQAGVQASVAVVREDVVGDPRLVAYVVAGDGVTVTGLRSALQQQLPGYLVPSAVVLLDALPLTAHGKVDRQALPVPEGTDGAAGYVSPRTGSEAALAGIWAAVLHREQVSVTDSFFDLGGHSLLATQVIARVRETFQVELPLRSLFEAPSVAGLAERIEQAQRVAQGMLAPPIRPVPRDGALPLSFAQQRIWFLDQLQPGSATYNIPAALRLEGPLDVDALVQALSMIVARHEALRTTFATTNEGRPGQIIGPAQPLLLPLIDLQELPEEAQASEVQRLVREEAQRPFDLVAGPLLRACLLHVQADAHVLLLTMHHIIADGWSWGVFFRELSALYAATVSGAAAALPSLPIQYADYAVWQRAWLQGEVLEAQLAYWRQQLHPEGTRLTTLQLPTDYPRPAISTLRGTIFTFTLSQALNDGLVALSRREGVTLFMTLLTAFQALLHRYSRQDDIVVGTPIAGRTRAETEDLIGCFINMLALRADLSGRPTFREALRRVREMTLSAYAHQDLSFEQVVDALQPDRDLSRHPLFQVMFAVQSATHAPLELPGLTLEQLPIDLESVKFDLNLTLAETDAGLAGVLEYSTDLFSAETMARLVGHYETLLAAIVSDADQRLVDLPLLTAPEREQIVVAWNATAVSYPAEPCLHDLIVAQVARTPDATAVVFNDQRLSYADLNARANQLAHALRTLGVGPEVHVGVCLHRSLDLVIALVAILKAGGAYVPLDPGYPAERLQFMVGDAQVLVLLTTSAFAERVDAPGTRLLCLDTAWPEIAQESTADPVTGVTADNLAYIIYTSGSTGRPKGAMNTHRAIVNRLLWMQDAYQLTAEDRVLQKTPFSFDVSVWEFFWPLLTGATLVVARPDGHKDPMYLVEAIQRNAITTLHFVPSMLQVFLDAEDVQTCRSLRQVICSGEALPAALRDRFFTRLQAELHNLYGPTEAAVDVSYWPCQRERERALVPIGYPIANTQLYVLDAQLQPVPVGVPGELHIGGVQLARGYYNRPELTAEKFIPDPFRASPGARLYRTGDLARYLPDGAIDYLGRIDHQVKLRGFRIELGEIEAVVSQHPDVREVVVVVREDVPGEQRLVAYVVPTADYRSALMDTAAADHDPSRSITEAFVADLQAFVKQQLPEYMVPSAVVPLDALSLLPNGKVDRRALPAPTRLRPELEADFAAPETPVETRLAAIWAAVLRLPQVGIHNNFFALGGDSILSIQIVARAKQAGIQLTPRQIFQYQTIAELAAVAGTTTTVTAEQGLIAGAVPLTPIQHWFFSREHPEPHHWNQVRLLEVRQPLDVTLLRQAIQQLMIHHDALRLRFVRTEAGWQQQHAPVEDAPVVVQVDLTAQPSAAQATTLEMAATELQSSLDLTTGPLMRVALFMLGADQRDRLLIIIHHLVVDTVSWGILLEDLWTAYDQLQRGATIALPAKTTSFKQWAEQLTTYAQSDTLRQELDYWLTLAQHVGAPLPVDYPGGANTVESARDMVMTLSKDETQALLQEVPPVYRTQINDVLLTALTQACASWTGTPRLLVDLEGHGREELFDEVDLTRTVGWFTSLYPVLLDLRQAEGPGVALKAVKEQLRQIPHRGIGYGVLRYLGAEADAAALQVLPPAQISFNYLGQAEQDAHVDGLLGPAQSPQGFRSHLLEITSLVVDGELHIHWTYSAALHAPATIAALAQGYLTALRALIAHCQLPTAGGSTPADFPLARLDQARLDRLLGTDRLVEDLYPLSPMQQGMLFHTLYAADAGMYVNQLICTIPAVDVPPFQRAWQQVVDRHPILRTAFVWDGLPTPLQIVRRQVAVPWTVEDWRDLDAATQAARLDAVVAADRRRGFDLAQAPLLRLALFQVTETAYHFLWSQHGLLLDGWSGPLVLNEVLRAYAAFASGREVAYVQPRPFRAYIAWLAQQEQQQVEAFWRQTLAGVTAPTPLGVDQPLGTTPGASGYGEQVIALPEATSAALQALTRQHGLTLNTVVQGAWALLLSRYSGAADVVFGATVAGRPPDLPGVETMVGLFINTLPVRVRVPQDAVLLTWLQQLQQQQAELRQYEHSPLVQIQGWSAVPRGQPLFESLVVFENYPAALGERAMLELQQVRTVEQVNYPLTLASSPGHPLRLQVSYDRRRFADATIARLLGHLATLLTGMAAQPTTRLGTLPLLDAAERAQLLADWPVTPAAPAPTACLHDLIAAQAARTPDACALVYGDTHLTYRALEQQATQLAYALRQHGVGPEVPVALLLERSPVQVVALLAVLKAGGAYLPLDPALPAARLQFVLADAQVPLLLTQQALLPTLPSETAAAVLCLDRDGPAIAQAPAVALPVVGLEQLAYLIYTSGSTGQPKGVQVAQRGIANLAQAQIAAFGVQADSRVLQFAALSFDAALAEVAQALVAGATLVLAPREALLPGPALLTLLREQAITHVTLPPSVLAALPDAALPALATIITAGEACPASVVARWGTSHRLINAYGPTEATVCATLGVTTADGREPTIGRPIANGRVYVLDAQLEPVPVGVAGEIYIGGIGVARGYHHRPALTAEQFVPDPFSAEPGARLYATGDRGRWRADGQLEFLGRIDQQVKLRGYRIELGEVAAVLRAHPAVQDAHVLLREDLPGDRRLVAYVVATSEDAPPVSDLRSCLRNQLPAYMVPSAFVVLDALPLTPHGKVDRNALPAPDGEALARDGRYIAPRTPIEEVLAGIWAEVLRLERISVEDTFFDQGGHSLLATQVVSRIREAFQIELPLRSLFDPETLTIARLAERIEAMRWVSQGHQAQANTNQEDWEAGEL